MKATNEAADARSQAEDGMEACVVVPVRRTRNSVAESTHGYEEEVHDESRPYQQSGFAISPHFTHNVVDDIAHGEDDETTCQGERPKGNLLCFEHVCCNETNAEEDAEKHEQHAHLILCFFHFSCFLRGLPSTRVCS